MTIEQQLADADARYAALYKAAHDYFHAVTSRSSALAAPALRDILATAKPTRKSQAVTR